jgi:hypothetical protein
MRPGFRVDEHIADDEVYQRLEGCSRKDDVSDLYTVRMASVYTPALDNVGILQCPAAARHTVARRKISRAIDQYRRVLSKTIRAGIYLSNSNHREWKKAHQQ